MTDEKKICPFISRVEWGDVFVASPEPGLGGHYEKGRIFIEQPCLGGRCAAWTKMHEKCRLIP